MVGDSARRSVLGDGIGDGAEVPIAPTRDRPDGRNPDHSTTTSTPSSTSARPFAFVAFARDVPESAAPRPPNRPGADARCSRTTGGRDPGVGSDSAGRRFESSPKRSSEPRQRRVFDLRRGRREKKGVPSSTGRDDPRRRRGRAHVVVRAVRPPRERARRIEFDDDFGASDPDGRAAPTRERRAPRVRRGVRDGRGHHHRRRRDRSCGTPNCSVFQQGRRGRRRFVTHHHGTPTAPVWSGESTAPRRPAPAGRRDHAGGSYVVPIGPPTTVTSARRSATSLRRVGPTRFSRPDGLFPPTRFSPPTRRFRPRRRRRREGRRRPTEDAREVRGGTRSRAAVRPAARDASHAKRRERGGPRGERRRESFERNLQPRHRGHHGERQTLRRTSRSTRARRCARARRVLGARTSKRRNPRVASHSPRHADDEASPREAYTRSAPSSRQARASPPPVADTHVEGAVEVPSKVPTRVPSKIPSKMPSRVPSKMPSRHLRARNPAPRVRLEPHADQRPSRQSES